MKDVWFAQHKGKLYMAWARPGEPPFTTVVRVQSIRTAYEQIRKKNVQIANIGICWPEMLGLE